MRSTTAAAASGAYLVGLLLGYGLLGWILAAFQVPWPVWLGTLGITLHLIYSGSAAIALSGGWVVGVMFLAATSKAWAAVWGVRIPHEQPQLWAEGLLLIWLGATGLVFLLAFAGSVLHRLDITGRYGFYRFISLIWGAIGIGWICYQLYHG